MTREARTGGPTARENAAARTFSQCERELERARPRGFEPLTFGSVVTQWTCCYPLRRGFPSAHVSRERVRSARSGTWFGTRARYHRFRPSAASPRIRLFVSVDLTLPQADRAHIDARKLRDYALNPDHPKGRHKARVFQSALGVGRDDWEYLRDQILEGIVGRQGKQHSRGQPIRPRVRATAAH